MSAALSVQGVSVTYGGVEALTDVSFSLDHSGIVGIIGPNGAGKTTLFNCISGAARSYSGSISLASTPLNPLSPAARARAGIRRTFQNIALFDGMSVLDNVRSGADHSGSLSREAARKRVSWLLNVTGLADYVSASVSALSLGYRKRVEVARALAGKPQVLLLDEPTAGIHPTDAQEIMSLVKRLRDDEGIAILLVEHEMPTVMSNCDRVIAMNFGRIIAEGTPAEIRADYLVRESYLGGQR